MHPSSRKKAAEEHTQMGPLSGSVNPRTTVPL